AREPAQRLRRCRERHLRAEGDPRHHRRRRPARGPRDGKWECEAAARIVTGVSVTRLLSVALVALPLALASIPASAQSIERIYIARAELMPAVSPPASLGIRAPLALPVATLDTALPARAW